MVIFYEIFDSLKRVVDLEGGRACDDMDDDKQS